MEDIAPKLLKKIQKDFQTKFDRSDVIYKLYAKVRDGTATYAEANEFSIAVGNILAEVFKINLSSAVLPDGKMYYNIAERIITPMMTNNYNLITDITSQVQVSLNKSANIAINAIAPELNQDRIIGIINKISNTDNFDDVAWALDEPVKNFSQSIVDDAIKSNAEFHSKLGLRPVITRKVAGDCCDWCKAISGMYSYPDNVPKDVYRRHQRCRCVVDYNPKEGKVQNVHSKSWRSTDEEIKFEERKKIGLQDKKEQSEKRIQKSKKIQENNLTNIKLSDLQELAKKTAIKYYESGLSGISFGNADIEKAAEKLARSGSRTSLKKDIISMRRKMNENK